MNITCDNTNHCGETAVHITKEGNVLFAHEPHDANTFDYAHEWKYLGFMSCDQNNETIGNVWRMRFTHKPEFDGTFRVATTETYYVQGEHVDNFMLNLMRMIAEDLEASK